MISNEWDVKPLADLVSDAIGGLWGSSPDTNKPEEEDVVVIRGADFKNWNTRGAADAAPRRVAARSIPRRRLAPGDLVLEVSGGSPAQPVGRVLVIDERAIAQTTKPLVSSNFCRRLRLKAGIDPVFVKRQLDWLYASGHTDAFQTSTTNIRNLQVEDFLAGTQIALPPLAEQRQIVSVITEIDEMQSSSSVHLASAKRAIERFRQAVLVAACSGRLSEDWWEHNRGLTVDALIQQLVEEQSAIKDPLSEPDCQLVGDLPSGWRAVTLRLLIDRIEAGKSFAAEPRPATAQEWGVVKVSAMSWGRFLEAQNKAVSDSRRINPSYEIKSGDLLISRANTVDLVGATVLVGDIRPRLLLSDKSLRLVPRRGIDKAWLNHTLRSPLVRSQFSDWATGTSDSMRNLSQVKILSVTLPLPPTDEQREIGRRVDQLLSAADEVQRRIETAARRVERSSQAILAKAFRHNNLLAAINSGGGDA